jgi:hypothetical protein
MGAKDRRVPIYFKPELWETICELARREGITPSELVRRILAKVMGGSA